MSEDFIPIKLEFREGTIMRRQQDEIDSLKERLNLTIETLQKIANNWKDWHGMDAMRLAKETLKIVLGEDNETL